MHAFWKGLFSLILWLVFALESKYYLKRLNGDVYIFLKDLETESYSWWLRVNPLVY